MLGRVSASDGPRGCRLVDIDGSNVDDMALFRDILMLIVKVIAKCSMLRFSDSMRCDRKRCDATRDDVVGDGCS